MSDSLKCHLQCHFMCADEQKVHGIIWSKSWSYLNSDWCDYINLVLFSIRTIHGSSCLPYMSNVKIPYQWSRDVQMNLAEKQQDWNFCSSPSMSHHQAAPQFAVCSSPHASHLSQPHSHHPFSQINLTSRCSQKFLPERTYAIWNWKTLLEDGQISISTMSLKPEKR